MQAAAELTGNPCLLIQVGLILRGLNSVEQTTAAVRQLLNYAETVNFRRAFVRWNGVTPSEYGQRHMAESD